VVATERRRAAAVVVVGRSRQAVAVVVVVDRSRRVEVEHTCPAVVLHTPVPCCTAVRRPGRPMERTSPPGSRDGDA